MRRRAFRRAVQSAAWQGASRGLCLRTCGPAGRPPDRSAMSSSAIPMPVSRTSMEIPATDTAAESRTTTVSVAFGRPPRRAANAFDRDFVACGIASAPHVLCFETGDEGCTGKAVGLIWVEKTSTASRVRGRIEVVLDWATAPEASVRRKSGSLARSSSIPPSLTPPTSAANAYRVEYVSAIACVIFQFVILRNSN
jgi:hypothetical protein